MPLHATGLKGDWRCWRYPPRPWSGRTCFEFPSAARMLRPVAVNAAVARCPGGPAAAGASNPNATRSWALRWSQNHLSSTTRSGWTPHTNWHRPALTALSTEWSRGERSGIAAPFDGRASIIIVVPPCRLSACLPLICISHTTHGQARSDVTDGDTASDGLRYLTPKKANGRSKSPDPITGAATAAADSRTERQPVNADHVDIPLGYRVNCRRVPAEFSFAARRYGWISFRATRGFVLVRRQGRRLPRRLPA